MTYLGKYTILTLIITFSFLQEYCPFLFEMCPTSQACIPFWTNFKWKNESPLRDYIYISFSRDITYQEITHTYPFHHIFLKSCIGFHLGAWLSTHLVIPSFCMTSSIFSLTICTKLGLPHPMIIGLTHYICDQSLNLTGIHLL
jgi:hypothetical protein